MTTASAPAVVVEANGLLYCCAWCLSAIVLRELHRQHHCSDGICPSCQATLAVEAA
jgi:hypothetical protein